MTNSFTILLVSPTNHPLANAVAMNITGFVVFYLFERIWNQVGWGRMHQMAGDGASGNHVPTEEPLQSSASA